jgi:hypothetical protein
MTDNSVSDRFAGLPSCIGVTLESLYLNEDGVPSFVPVVCRYIVQNRETVGVFRLCGNHALVQELGVFLNFPRASLPPSGGVHDAASFLKLWLRSLPVPLITPAVINQYFEQGNPNSVVQVIKALAAVNRKCVANILWLMRQVVEKAAVNQMSFANLAICFTTSLLQNNRGLVSGFRFCEFFEKALDLLKPDGDDFAI